MNNEINNENVITFGSWVISRFPAFSSACFLLINFPRSCPLFHEMIFISVVGRWKVRLHICEEDNNQNNAQALCCLLVTYRNWIIYFIHYLSKSHTAATQWFSCFVTTGGYKYTSCSVGKVWKIWKPWACSRVTFMWYSHYRPVNLRTFYEFCSYNKVRDRKCFWWYLIWQIKVPPSVCSSATTRLPPLRCLPYAPRHAVKGLCAGTEARR